MDAITTSSPDSDPTRVLGILQRPRESGETINLNEKRADGWSPTLLAAATGNPRVFQGLLENGADLTQTIDFQSKKATPFVLAAQYGREGVMEVILNSSQFTPSQLREELRNAHMFKQPALARQLTLLRRIAQPAIGPASLGASATCTQEARDEFPSDLVAKTYQAINATCAICLNIPGSGDQTKLLDGSLHTGDSAVTKCCAQTYCKTCLAQVARCPHCRHEPFNAGSYQIVANTVPKFQWLEADAGGSQKVPLPGQPIDQPQMDRFRAQFVQVPAGRLPDGTQIAALEADRYPVTREFWNEIMGGMPEHVPADKRATWNQSPRAPVTHVNWENQNGSRAEVQEFLRRLNERERAMGCTYDLPTDKQLWYLIRGDVTGSKKDLYSAGVTAKNVNNFVTHAGNSNGQIQPVGNKALNAFGIELGNVWKMSKDLYDPAHPNWGRSVRGGGWYSDVDDAESRVRLCASAGSRHDNMGVPLLRTCR